MVEWVWWTNPGSEAEGAARTWPKAYPTRSAKPPSQTGELASS